jgi:hypothetical protein
MHKVTLNENLIAPCGMNCGICKAFLRLRTPCLGCRYAEQNWPKTRMNCRLRLCEKRNGRFCYDCPEFPCDRLKHLDNRYRTRYGMSEIENLEYIRDKGMDQFLDDERKKWVSNRGVLCVHNKKYYRKNRDDRGSP